MDNIEVYSFEDEDGIESTYTTRDIFEAKQYARQHGLKLIANVFSWIASDEVEDNTPDPVRLCEECSCELDDEADIDAEYCDDCQAEIDEEDEDE